MLWLIGVCGAAAAILSVASACTWQQAYSGGQTWQRNACNRLVEQTERDRCLRNADLPYKEYRRQVTRSLRVAAEMAMRFVAKPRRGFPTRLRFAPRSWPFRPCNALVEAN
jgi:hypothetical protein